MWFIHNKLFEAIKLLIFVLYICNIFEVNYPGTKYLSASLHVIIQAKQISNHTIHLSDIVPLVIPHFTITPTYVAKLGVIPRLTRIDAQKIDGSLLKIYEIVTVIFFIENHFRRIWFFKKIFLLADISMVLVLEIFFLSFSNTDIKFNVEEFIWRKFTIMEVWCIT